MKKVRLIIITAAIIFLAFMFISEGLSKNTRGKENVSLNENVSLKEDVSLKEAVSLNKKIYSYLSSSNRQKSVFNTAIALNNKTSANSCVYFISEVLRRNGVEVPKVTGNTSQLLPVLKEKGFRKETDYRDLMPGDIVFTTDERGNKNGTPSHTYVFMKWAEEGSYDYAYICDNQAKDYDNQIYHIRNIKNRDTVKGIPKDAFSFFMRPE